ncbi:hypothetical protein T07_7550 [Trichinella nelsoni]|uniref:Uncharacterized protein n=1 Tax=Trichinella nelsoni TaxID=6336 RepID=A0A0V0SF90_9BILA|nr:hypothetical protein T07_7550 [Trichinella nelsoni]
MDAPSEQSPATNDSNRTMNNRKRPTATYDSEMISLTHGMDRLQAHCARATDMEAIREVSTASIMLIPKLPIYDGDVLQFKGFWDQFEATVHRRENLQNNTKLMYLQSCLSGAARQAIDGIITSAKNHPEVVQLLLDCFYRASDILDAHILEILNMKHDVIKERELQQRLLLDSAYALAAYVKETEQNSASSNQRAGKLIPVYDLPRESLIVVNVADV